MDDDSTSTIVPEGEDKNIVGDNDFREELDIRLKYAGVFFAETTEYIRHLNDIQEVCSSSKYNLVHWDSNRGLCIYEERPKSKDSNETYWSYNMVQDTKNPSKALRVITDIVHHRSPALDLYAERTLFCFRFFDSYFKVMPQSLEFIDTIINVGPYCKNNNVSLLFYGPNITVPSHLADDAFMLNYTMPGEEVIGKKFDFIALSVKTQAATNPEFATIEDPEVGFRHQAIRAALGQSAPMAESTFAHAMAYCKAYDKKFLQVVKRQTLKRIREHGLVQAIETSEHHSFDNAFAGYEWVKQMFVDDMAPFSDPAAYTLDKKVPKPDGCLIGSPAGFGKSLLPKAVAWEYNLPLLRVDASCIKDKHYGESEQKLRKILDIPRQVFGRGGCIIWFDEADKLFGGFSKSGDDSTSGTGQAILGQMLTWLQERKHDDRDHSYVICTFNNGDQLPDALIRPGRFSTRIWLHLPTADDRKHIFKLHLERMGRSVEDFKIDNIVKKSNKFSGAEIEGAVETMAKRAYSRDIKDEEALLLSVVSEIHPAAGDIDSEYSRQEEWARSRKFGAQGKASAASIVTPEDRTIVIDKKNSLKSKETTNE